MIFQWHNLLAADDDYGLVEILVFVVFIVLGLFGHIIKKVQEKRQADEAGRKVDEAKHRHARQVASEHSQAAPQAEPPLPPPLQPVAGAKPQPARADLAQGVRDEVRKVRQHLSTEQASRSRRLAHIKDMKAGIAPEPAQAETAVGERPKIRLNLTSPKTARTAIICAEILGPPKALRTTPEPWEL